MWTARYFTELQKLFRAWLQLIIFFYVWIYINCVNIFFLLSVVIRIIFDTQSSHKNFNSISLRWEKPFFILSKCQEVSKLVAKQEENFKKYPTQYPTVVCSNIIIDLSCDWKMRDCATELWLSQCPKTNWNPKIMNIMKPFPLASESFVLLKFCCVFH